MRITSWSYAGGGVLRPLIQSNKSASAQVEQGFEPVQLSAVKSP
jgi:hypothetical protein